MHSYILYKHRLLVVSSFFKTWNFHFLFFFSNIHRYIHTNYPSIFHREIMIIIFTIIYHIRRDTIIVVLSKMIKFRNKSLSLLFLRPTRMRSTIHRTVSRIESFYLFFSSLLDEKLTMETWNVECRSFRWRVVRRDRDAG